MKPPEYILSASHHPSIQPVSQSTPSANCCIECDGCPQRLGFTFFSQARNCREGVYIVFFSTVQSWQFTRKVLCWRLERAALLSNYSSNVSTPPLVGCRSDLTLYAALNYPVAPEILLSRLSSPSRTSICFPFFCLHLS